MNIQTQQATPDIPVQEDILSDGHALNVLDIISQDPTLSQREMAERAGISVGLVNLIVKRLVRTGYIKAMNLNARKTEYLLTPKGLSEKTRRSYQYLLKTLRTYRQFLNRTKALIETLKSQGHTQFVVLGEGEIANLLILTLREMGDPSIAWRHQSSWSDHEQTNGEVWLDCRTHYQGNSPGISVLSQLLKVSV